MFVPLPPRDRLLYLLALWNSLLVLQTGAMFVGWFPPWLVVPQWIVNLGLLGHFIRRHMHDQPIGYYSAAVWIALWIGSMLFGLFCLWMHAS